jgi:hypothetical protein
MDTKERKTQICIVTVVVAALSVLLGCHEMKIETSLNADGSGTRHMELLIEDEGEDSTLTVAEYRELMGVTDDRGWTRSSRRMKQEQSDKISDFHSFTRNTEATDLFEMTAMSGDIFIRASDKNPAFADVYLTNAIQVESGMSNRGRTIVYRETLSWSGLLEAFLDYRLQGYRKSLEKIYPGLTPAETDEWLAFFQGTFMAAVDDGIFEMGSGDRAMRFAASIERVVQYAMDKIRAHDPDADDSIVIHMTWSTFVEWDEIDEPAEEMQLMGVELAAVLNLTVRIDIPGRVVETNADRQEVYADPRAGRQKLVWEIDTGESISKPIEIYVKTEIPR